MLRMSVTASKYYLIDKQEMNFSLLTWWLYDTCHFKPFLGCDTIYCEVL